ncbi:MAG: branched-chain amino acid ABC transporter permease [Rhodobiaceae bacterium]|nr:branched-chain amino acid ABC transporter permease [Rhodobiaceae bacterium]MCC0055158.1 branched-chain amino acid ABC transporter permease [Rhodobiaceae bacterium]
MIAEMSGNPFWTVLASRMLIFAIAAISLDLILGYGAMVSFGQAGAVGIGAYSVGIAASHGLNEGLIVLPLAVLASGLFSLVTGFVAVRTRGVYFIMITLAFGQMIYFTATSLSAYGGDDGLTVWSRSTIFGSGILEDERVFYAFVLILLAAVWVLARLLVASPFGKVITAARQNEARVESLGFDIFAHRLAIYTISGAIAGLAGGLLANHAEFVSPAYMNWQRSGELIVMVVLGGMGTLFGPIAGALAYLGLEHVLAGFWQHWRIILGPLLILVVLRAPGGLGSFIKTRRT